MAQLIIQITTCSSTITMDSTSHYGIELEAPSKTLPPSKGRDHSITWRRWWKKSAAAMQGVLAKMESHSLESLQRLSRLLSIFNKKNTPYPAKSLAGKQYHLKSACGAAEKWPLWWIKARRCEHRQLSLMPELRMGVPGTASVFLGSRAIICIVSITIFKRDTMP